MDQLSLGEPSCYATDWPSVSDSNSINFLWIRHVIMGEIMRCFKRCLRWSSGMKPEVCLQWYSSSEHFFYQCEILKQPKHVTIQESLGKLGSTRIQSQWDTTTQSLKIKLYESDFKKKESKPKWDDLYQLCHRIVPSYEKRSVHISY